MYNYRCTVKLIINYPRAVNGESLEESVLMYNYICTVQLIINNPRAVNGESPEESVLLHDVINVELQPYSTINLLRKGKVKH